MACYRYTTPACLLYLDALRVTCDFPILISLVSKTISSRAHTDPHKVVSILGGKKQFSTRVLVNITDGIGIHLVCKPILGLVADWFDCNLSHNRFFNIANITGLGREVKGQVPVDFLAQSQSIFL
jgi:hypothetical protein